MSLKDQIKALSGNKRRFLLLRIADLDRASALKIIGVKKSTYDFWCRMPEFVELNRQRDYFSQEYKQEAIQLLRRDNQLDAVLLESRIIARMKEEIDSGQYELIRTNLAREVYSKLISDLDYQPKTLALTWEERIQALFTGEKPQIEQGSIIDGEVTETTNSK